MKRVSCFICVVLSCLLLLNATGFAQVNVGSLPVTDEPITLTIGLTQKVDVISYEDNVLTRHIKELTGVDVEFVIYPATDANTKLELQVASNMKLPDILYTGMNDANRRAQFGEAGVIIPLQDYYNSEYGDAFKQLCALNNVDYDLLYKEVVSPDGNLYGMIRYQENTNNVYRNRAWINKTWLDKLGLELPKTYLDIIDIARAFRDKDPNGNNTADEIPMVGSKSWGTYPLEWMQNMFIYTGGRNDFLPLSETDGKLDTWYDKDAYREFLKYGNQLVVEGLYSPLSFSMNQAQIQTLTMSDPCVAGIVFSGGAINVMNSKDEFVPLEIPEGPEGKRYNMVYSALAMAACAITSYCEHPDIAFLVMNAMNIDNELQYWNRFGEKDVDWRLPAEGEISIYNEIGVKPSVYQLQQCWGETLPQQKMWHVEDCWPTLDMGIAAKLVYDPMSINEERLHAENVMLNMKYAPALDDVVRTITYNAQEVEQWGEMRTSLESYVDEARALFVMNKLDPNNDKDWENYLNALEQMKYKEILAMQQIAYDRMMGK